MQNMLKVGKNTRGQFVVINRRSIGTKKLKLSIGTTKKNSVIYFHFEQLSIIPVVFLLLTFNKYTTSEVLPFSNTSFLCFAI